jgi:hypothetical protein
MLVSQGLAHGSGLTQTNFIALVGAVVAAVTAGIITLVIEYAAKPWLDARKDRILEHSSARRRALKDLERASYSQPMATTTISATTPQMATARSSHSQHPVVGMCVN